MKPGSSREDLTEREFGPFRVVGALARGGTASVYKVYQPAMDRYLALKVLSRHLSADPQFLTRFRREALVLAQLQHPRILQVYDCGESDGYAFLVMPLVTGGTLAAALKRGQMPFGTGMRIVGQICDALDYAHSKNIIHRDIKPTNILLDERQNCVVADFGLARILEDATNITIAGSVMGTPPYMSPEQVAGGRVGPASDIYSLGIVLYELLTGRVPFIADTPTAVMMAHLTAPVPPPRTLNPALPVAIENVVLRALARTPEDRFASALEFHAALASAVRDVPNGVMSESLPGSNRAADVSNIFPTIGSDAFLADVRAAPWNAPTAVAHRSGHARTFVAACAVGTMLSGAAIGILWQKRGTVVSTPPPPRATLPPPAAAVTPPEFPIPGVRPDQSSPGGVASLEVHGVAGSTVAPVGRPVPDERQSASVTRVERIAETAVAAELPPARILVDTHPASRVYVDNVFRGEADANGRLVVETSVPGTHVVRVSLAGKVDFEERVETIRGQTLALRRALTDAAGSLRIQTSVGAEVLVDNTSRGVTDTEGVLLLGDIPPGRHDIRVLHLGKKEFRQVATLEAGRESVIEARLEDLAPAQTFLPTAVRSPEPPAGPRFLLFHFVDGNWHFGILTISRRRIAWDETKPATNGYAVGDSGGFLRSIDPGLHMDNFIVGCDEVVDVGTNAAVVGEHIRLRTRNYNFAAAVRNKDGKLVPKADLALSDLRQAVEDVCPGVTN